MSVQTTATHPTLRDKAAGAIRRLDSVGQSIDVRGRSMSGKTINLSNYRGKLVVIHFWATWCELCKQDVKVLKDMQAKYGRRGLELIGVCLDNERDAGVSFVRSSRMNWPQLFEEGGLDGRLATQYGILTGTLGQSAVLAQ